MGLAASQVRLLSLTARQHAVEYDAQRIEAQKLQLSNDSDEVYNTYLDALDATKIQYKVVLSDGSTSYQDATFTTLAAAGFLFNVNGTICNSFATVKQALSDQGIVDLTASDSYTLLTTLVSEGYVVLMEQLSDPETGYSYNYTNGTISYTDDDDSTNDKEYAFTTTVDDGSGMAVYKVFEDTSVSTSTKVQEVSDEVGLKKAEAQYEADMNKINAKDTKYDTELSQLETEREAISTEIETLEQVAKDNIDRTFKIFG
ncbi:MAG: hypothetical protein LUB59_06415 [Candidatus Gastranaerophilales bacterium]|nr:hypothetical protein [Candidatus Gastranaerophilales bacterium]